jgi:hypothetical protein
MQHLPVHDKNTFYQHMATGQFQKNYNSKIQQQYLLSSATAAFISSKYM